MATTRKTNGAAEKAGAKKTVRRAATPRRTAAAAPEPTAQAAARRAVSAGDRFRLIQEQAYFLAQRDGFKSHPDVYWFAAERAVAELQGEVSAETGGTGI